MHIDNNIKDMFRDCYNKDIYDYQSYRNKMFVYIYKIVYIMLLNV